MADGSETDLKRRIADLERRLAEADAVAEEARFARSLLQDVFDQVDDGVAVVDRNGIVRRANGVLARWFALAAPLEGRSCADAFGGDAADAVAESNRSGSPVTRETRIAAEGRGDRFLELNAFPFDGIDAIGGGAILYVRDITQRRVTEESLRLSEERFAKVFHTSPDAVTLTRLSDGMYLEVNQGFERLTGYTASEVVGRSSLEINLWVDAEARDAWTRGLLADGESVGFEADFRRKDGSIVTGLISAKLADVGSTRCVLAVTRDITDRKRSRRKLEESERNYRTIIEHSLEGIVISQDLRVRFCNSRFLEMFGYASVDEVLGRPIEDLVDPSSWGLVRNRVAAREAGDSETDHYTFGARRSDGTRFEVETLASRVTYNGRPASLAVMRDATERRRLEEQLRQAQKMEAIGTLAGGIAHDFNNLLTSIIGNLELAGRYEKKQAQTYLAKAGQAAQRAADLVQQILTFSRKSHAERAPVRPAAVVDDCTAMLRETVDRRIAVEVSADESRWSVNGDAAQIEQVLMNLAINARDAIEETLADRADDADERRAHAIRIRIDDLTVYEEYLRGHHGVRLGQFVRFRVEDTGRGMTDEVVARIFEPFYTTKDPGVGTGLGLATAFGIVEQHEGWIEVGSRVGVGSRFDVFLPRYPGDVEPGETESRPPVADVVGGNETILLVDDEKMIRDLGEAILTRLGYTVILAENGEVALDRFNRERERIDLVILDLVMPYLTGWEVLEQMRAVKPGQKILLSSGYDLRVEGRGRASLSPMEYVSKPYRMDVLARKVRMLLDAPETGSL